MGRATSTMLLLAGLGLAGCTGRLPPYGVADQPIAGQPPAADETFTLPDGTVLPARVWYADGPPQAVVLALHGFNDSRDAWALPGPVFGAHGITVFAPDQRGFGATDARGTWPGTARLIEDADAMARGLHQRFPAAKLFVMGESMGGAIAIDVAAQPDPPPLAGVVALAPAVWGRPEQGLALAATLALGNAVLPGYHIKGTEVPLRIRASDNREALVALARDPLTLRRTEVSVLAGLVDLMDSAQQEAPKVHLPLLVAYGGHDQLIPRNATAALWTKLPASTRRAFYPDGFHLLMRDRDRDRVTGDVIAWMSDPAALLPSGADSAASAWAAAHRNTGPTLAETFFPEPSDR